MEQSALLALLSASTSAGESVPATWNPETGEASWVGVQALRSDGPWPGGSTLTVSLAPGLEDRSGNSQKQAMNRQISVLAVDEPQPSFEFDQAPLGLWGNAAHLSQSEECEQGGCVDLKEELRGAPLPVSLDVFSSEELEDLGEEAGMLRYRSSWGTWSASLPEPGPDRVLDVALFKGLDRLAPNCILSFSKDDKARLLIDRVWVE